MACRRAGASHIAAWVKPMDDEEARSQLRRANRQGEMSFRENARHVYLSVTPKQGKKGDAEKGLGLTAYAKDQGIDQSQASREYACGKVDALLHDTCHEVWKEMNRREQHEGASYGRHLATIHKAPESDWPWLVSELLKEEWSVKDTEAAVKAVSTIGAIPEWLTSWLDPDKWKRKYLTH